MRPELQQFRDVVRELYPRATFNGEGSYEENAEIRVSHPACPTFYVGGPVTKTGRPRRGGKAWYLCTNQSDYIYVDSLSEAVLVVVRVWGTSV